MTNEERSHIAQAGLRQSEQITQRIERIQRELTEVDSDLATLEGLLQQLRDAAREGAPHG